MIQGRTYQEIDRRRLERAERAAEKQALAELSGVGILPDRSPQGDGRMQRQSTKGRSIDAAYAKLRGPFLEVHRRCELKLGICSGIATQVHHMVRRSAARELIADERNFVAACEPCHAFVTVNAGWALDNRWTLRLIDVTDVGPGRFINLRPRLLECDALNSRTTSQSMPLTHPNIPVNTVDRR